MASSDRAARNGFVAFARKIYNPIGFAKGYNFIMSFIFAGALFGFCLARIQYLDFYGRFCNVHGGESGAAPGECLYHLKQQRYRIGIVLHLAGVLPAGILACFQFVPVVLRKLESFHRVNVYLLLILSLIGTAGAYMIADVAFSGGSDLQTGVGFHEITFVGSLAMSIHQASTNRATPDVDVPSLVLRMSSNAPEMPARFAKLILFSLGPVPLSLFKPSRSSS